MNKLLITITLTILLSGCVIPVSSSCSSNPPLENSNNGFPPKGQDCSELDAAIYLTSALYKEAQKQPIKEKPSSTSDPKDKKCTDLIGKSQKECLRNKNASYDPLDEL